VVRKSRLRLACLSTVLFVFFCFFLSFSFHVVVFDFGSVINLVFGFFVCAVGDRSFFHNFGGFGCAIYFGDFIVVFVY
jgi:hypothetical protein